MTTPNEPERVRRHRGLSMRWRLTLSYVLVVAVTGAALWVIAYLWALRYIPDDNLYHAGGQWAPNRSDIMQEFLPRATFAYVALLVVGLVGGWFLAGHMLRPLRQITEAVRLTDSGSLSHRISMRGRGDEFRDLADVFDDMLARLEQQVDDQRRFAANASHELRTPLAVTRTMLEVAQADPDRDVNTLLHRLESVNSRAIEATEALLLLSRIERNELEREPVDLSIIAEEAIETFQPVAERASIELHTDLAPANTSGHRALLERIAANLVHNAVVHSHVPNEAGGEIWVRTDESWGVVRLLVANTGVPLDPAVVATLAQPFQRGDRTATRASGEHAGAGLGLSIVATIARRHGGTLTLTARTEGGLIATVTLPRAQ